MSVMLGLVLAFAVGQSAPPVTTGAVSGRVSVEGTNAPVAEARVFLFPTGRLADRPVGRPVGPMGPPPQSVTDQSGRFTFDRIRPGEYRIDVQKTGYTASGADGGGGFTITVVAGQALDTIDLHLQKGAVIAGRVLDAAGEPAVDVHVMVLKRIAEAGDRAHIMPAPMQGPQQTNDLGEFRIAGLAPGEYLVAAMRRPMMAFGGAGQPSGNESAGMVAATTFYPGTIDQSTALPVSVAAGAEAGNINFALQNAKAFRVSGVVVDEAGNPVARAMVRMMGDPRNAIFGPAGSAQTLEDGTFAIGDVVPGSYHVNASVPMVMSSVGRGGGGGVWTSIDGGFTAGGAVNGAGGGTAQAISMPEVIVTDTDVSGVR